MNETKTTALSVERIGLRIENKNEPNTPEWIDADAHAAKVLRATDEYLKRFAVFDDTLSRCRCGQSLGGLLGSFNYGIVHGEGRCGECSWPARADHYIKDEVGEDLLYLNAVFPYHPDFVTKAEGSAPDGN